MSRRVTQRLGGRTQPERREGFLPGQRIRLAVSRDYRHLTGETWRQVIGGREVWRIRTPPAASIPLVYSLVAFLFYVSGGVATLLVAPQLQGTRRLVLVAVGVAAVGVGLAILRTGDLMPRSVRAGTNVLGTSLITVAVVAASASPHGVALFLLYLYVTVDAFALFPLGQAVRLQLFAAFAAVLAIRLQHGVPVGLTLTFLLVSAVVGLVVAILVRLSSTSLWDPGSDLLNRHALDVALSIRCQDAERTGRGFSLAAIEVEAPDCRPEVAARLVRELAQRWREACPPGVVWFRTRQWHFIALFDGEEPLDALVAGALQSCPPGVRASAGVADWLPGRGPTALFMDGWAAQAEAARNGLRALHHEVHAERVTALRRAIGTGELRLLYQPLVELPSRRISAAEALVRWEQPGRGMVPPDEFIGLAERSDLIYELGLWVLRRACRDAAGWRGPLAESRVSVNVSGGQLVRPEFVSDVVATLLDTALPPDRLVLEVTESTLHGDSREAVDALTDLRICGVRVAIDDFGTGYSSLARVADLPVDFIKVDKAFLRGVPESPERVALLDAIIGVANALSLRTVVEGIETEDQHAAVVAAGAGRGQGWLYGRPMPVEALSALAESAARELDLTRPPG